MARHSGKSNWLRSRRTRLLDEAHRRNGPVEMPASVLTGAIRLAAEVPFGETSKFWSESRGVAVGLERHPAMKLLCDWWENVRPEGEPYKPGMAMPLVREFDGARYRWGWPQIPRNSLVKNFNERGRNVARVGDRTLVLFQAQSESEIYDDEGLTSFLPNGDVFEKLAVCKEEMMEEDEMAWYCLAALATFQDRFPLEWASLQGMCQEKVVASASPDRQ